jgi:hypothetical protein
MTKNPYNPGDGSRPPYLAGRAQATQFFEKVLAGYPEKRRNLRVIGLRGVGKTVLLKEYQREAIKANWVVVRHQLPARLCNEAEFAVAMTNYLNEAADEFEPTTEALKKKLREARKAIKAVSMGPLSVTLNPHEPAPSILNDRLAAALKRVGVYAREQERGVLFLFDDAHKMRDNPKAGQFPLDTLLGAFTEAQDNDDEPLPVMLVLCGLPPLASNIYLARNNAVRSFRGLELENLRTTDAGGDSSEAALALVKPVNDSTDGALRIEPAVAERIAKDVHGYPYFLQWYGEALWEEADITSKDVINMALYRRMKDSIQQSLDAEFFEPQYASPRAADRKTLRIAAGLGDEGFTKGDLDDATKRSAGAMSMSLTRLIKDNLIYRDDFGIYAYTIPRFGDFVRRCHPRLAGDK